MADEFFISVPPKTQKTQTVSGFSDPAYDYISLTQNSTQDIFTFKIGGASGPTVMTKTITYTDSTKATLSTVIKT